MGQKSVSTEEIINQIRFFGKIRTPFELATNLNL